MYIFIYIYIHVDTNILYIALIYSLYILYIIYPILYSISNVYMWVYYNLPYNVALTLWIIFGVFSHHILLMATRNPAITSCYVKYPIKYPLCTRCFLHPRW